MEKGKLVIGSDHGGFRLKNHITEYLKTLGYEVEDYGTHDNSSCDYPDVAFKVAESIKNGLFTRGILICASGLGMAIAANKVKGIRAITCSETYSARMSVAHNNANVLTLGEKVVGSGLAEDIVKTWLYTKFDGGRHERRVNKINFFIE